MSTAIQRLIEAEGLPADYRERAIEQGATPVTSRELVRRLVDSGLRVRRSRATEAVTPPP